MLPDQGSQKIHAEIINVSAENYGAITYVRRKGPGNGDSVSGYSIDGIQYRVWRSTTLAEGSWASGPAQLVETSITDNGDGTESVTVRSQTPSPSREFFRLEVQPIN